MLDALSCTNQSKTSGSDRAWRLPFSTSNSAASKNDTVGKSQQAISAVLPIRVAACVPLRRTRLSVNPAVRFHDEAVLRAAKVRNRGTQRVLPAELETLRPETPQQGPCSVLGLGWGGAKLARSIDLRPLCGGEVRISSSLL